jgi:hypothetical protein
MRRGQLDVAATCGLLEAEAAWGGVDTAAQAGGVSGNAKGDWRRGATTEGEGGGDGRRGGAASRDNSSRYKFISIPVVLQQSQPHCTGNPTLIVVEQDQQAGCQYF